MVGWLVDWLAGWLVGWLVGLVGSKTEFLNRTENILRNQIPSNHDHTGWPPYCRQFTSESRHSAGRIKKFFPSITRPKSRYTNHIGIIVAVYRRRTSLITALLFEAKLFYVDHEM